MSKMSNLGVILTEMIEADQKMIDTATVLQEAFSSTEEAPAAPAPSIIERLCSLCSLFSCYPFHSVNPTEWTSFY